MARKQKLPTLVTIAAAIIMITQTSGCYRTGPGTGARPSLHQSALSTDNSPRMIADYQPWFGTRDHLDVGYSTQDPAVLKRQIQKAKDYGIYAFGVDWYGPRRPFEDRTYALLQRVASENHFHICLLYDETEEDNGHATDDALEAMDKAYRAYIGPGAPGRDAYVEYNGRPVIFIFPKRGNTDWDRVRAQVDSWDRPPLLIYKDIPPAKYAKDFDGYYGWVNVGRRGWTTDGSNWGEEYLESFYQRIKAKFPDKIMVGTVWPGFDDSKASWGLNRHIDRRCGQTFEDTLHTFRRHDDPDNPMPFMMIATWNDYEEGTAIENGVSNCNQQQAKPIGGGR